MKTRIVSAMKINTGTVCIIIERLIEEWHLYENQYEELSQWIKDTESDMKTESDLKATLEDKTEQLEKQQVSQQKLN